VAHIKRPRLAARHPVHVTMRLGPGLPSLRRQRTLELLVRAFGAVRERVEFRLAHFSIQTNHLHLIVEARDEAALGRGIQGLGVRLAPR
jgi:REP element-mobilizing transposase RayT